ncbi:hypothetical protein ACJX0J_041792, partial [Zea mays]
GIIAIIVVFTINKKKELRDITLSGGIDLNKSSQQLMRLKDSKVQEAISPYLLQEMKDWVNEVSTEHTKKETIFLLVFFTLQIVIYSSSRQQVVFYPKAFWIKPIWFQQSSCIFSFLMQFCIQIAKLPNNSVEDETLNLQAWLARIRHKKYIAPSIFHLYRVTNIRERKLGGVTGQIIASDLGCTI